MLRVPGSRTDLLHVKATRRRRTHRLLAARSAEDCPRKIPDRKVVFFAIGFETTAPANAMAVWQAHREGLANFSMLASHVLVPPGVRSCCSFAATIAFKPSSRPGHVCTVMGCRQYEDLAREFHVPIVVGGFEPVDLLEAILMLVKQLEGGEPKWKTSTSARLRATVISPRSKCSEGIRSLRSEMARHRRDPAERTGIRPEFAAARCRKAFGMAEFHVEESRECISA